MRDGIPVSRHLSLAGGIHNDPCLHRQDMNFANNVFADGQAAQIHWCLRISKYSADCKTEHNFQNFYAAVNNF